MKMTKIISTALLALAGVALLSPQVKAAYNPGDILLGFRASDGTATQDYMIDIGSYTSLAASAAGGTTVDLGNINTDLTAAFTNQWFTKGDIVFEAFGLNTAAKLAWIGNNQDASQPAFSLGNAGTMENAVNATTNTAYNNGTTGANTAGVLELIGANGSYSGNYAFGIYNHSESQINAPDFLTQYTLTSRGANASTEVGYFNIASNGEISFVPEPTTTAALATGALLLGTTLRRRKA